jgi:hypothetical protein
LYFLGSICLSVDNVSFFVAVACSDVIKVILIPSIAFHCWYKAFLPSSHALAIKISVRGYGRAGMAEP